MKILSMPLLISALIAAAAASGADDAEVRRQNRRVDYQLAPGRVYRIRTKLDDGVTVVTFPGPISEIAGRNISPDGKDTDFIISAKPGASHFGVASQREGAHATLTVTYARKLYILYLEHVKDEAYANVVFGYRSDFSDATDVSETPDVTPDRLVSLIDLAKRYSAMKKLHPESVRRTERSDRKRIYKCGSYDIELLSVTRFDAEDTLVFEVVLVNDTSSEIPYDRHTFSACCGSELHYMSVADASGVMPPRSRSRAWFGITSTPSGGRNNLRADNDWTLGVTTKADYEANVSAANGGEPESR